MRILAITDIHSRDNLNPTIKKGLAEADLVIIAGDITNFGHAEEARSIINNLQLYNENILAIPGNCDHPDINDTFSEMGVNLHGIIKVM